MAMTLGSVFVLLFWGAMTQPRFGEPSGGIGPIKGRPPEVIAYLNPFVAQADVICGTQTSYERWCTYLSTLLNGNSGVVVFGSEPEPMPAIDVAVARVGPVVDTGFAPNDVIAVQQFGVSRNAFWPRSVAAWLVLSVILIFLSVQLVTPTRRWRFWRRRRRSA
jgi:hypothetical protein